MTPRRLGFAVMLGVVFVALGAWAASANTMYEYTGGPFTFTLGGYTTEDRISGYFVLADSFVTERVNDRTDVTPGVLEYRFTDGHQTLTQANSTAMFAVPLGMNLEREVPTGRGGYSWSLTLSAPTGEIVSNLIQLDGRDFGGLAGFSDFGDLCIGEAGCRGEVGVWTLTQTVPEPGTLALLAVGLGGVSLRAWNTRRRR